MKREEKEEEKEEEGQKNEERKIEMNKLKVKGAILAILLQYSSWASLS